ncbi:hypothetical protein ACIP5Y_24825 [Nocardia sp. NPDC088792]|uniref:hypothetical protein n=1 Tax=Nocardia sp. NPDC088792 TaxID=3364332 RepID=UPI0038007931
MTTTDKARSLTADAATLEDCATRLEELGTRLHGATGVSSQFYAFMTTYAARCRTAAKELGQIAALLEGKTTAGAAWPLPTPPGIQTLRQLSQLAINRLPIPGRPSSTAYVPPDTDEH